MKARALGGKNIRTRSSLLIDEKIKVDLPPDNYLHVLRYGLSLANVRYIFVTHTHYDHFHPDDLNMRRKPFAHLKENYTLHVYGNKQVNSRVNRILKNHPEINIATHLAEPFKPINAEGIKALPLLADHTRDQICLLFLFEKNGKTILQGYDSGWLPKETWKMLESFCLDLAILDCTNGALPYIRGHMGIDGVTKTANYMKKKGIADKDTIFVATHFSHNGGLLHEELTSKLELKGIKVAYDGFTVKI